MTKKPFYWDDTEAMLINKYNHSSPTGLICYYKNNRVVGCSRFTRLRTCCQCKKLSTPKKIQYRWFFGGQSNAEERMHGDLSLHGYFCMGCANKLRTLEKNWWAMRENKTLINKLKRGIK